MQKWPRTPPLALTSEIDPKRFRSISYTLNIFTYQYVKCQSIKYRTVCKMRKRSKLLSDLLSSISRHWPSFKSFWQVELVGLKTAFYKGKTLIQRSKGCSTTLSKNSDKMTKMSKSLDIIVHIFKKNQRLKNLFQQFVEAI